MSGSDTTGATTTSFAGGKELSRELRATSPEQIEAAMRELRRIKETARDYVVPSHAMHARVETDGNVKVAMMMPKGGLFEGTAQDFHIRKTAHEQIGDKLGIPGAYYRKMLDTAPGLLVNNVNYWTNFNPQNLMLRTVDGSLRAVLSDRYRALDSFDLVAHAAAVVKEVYDETGVRAVFQRLDLSDDKMFFRLMLPDFAAKITGRGDDLRDKGKLFSSGYKADNGKWGATDDDDPNGDWVFPAIVGGNSETGKGKLAVDMGAFRATCSNYIVVGTSLHRVHLGERLESGFELSADTRRVKDEAIWLEVRDMIKAAFDETKFRETVTNMNKAQAAVLDDPIAAVDSVVASFGMSDDDKENILRELLSPSRGVNPGMTLWGLANAVTATAHAKPLIEAYDFEKVGGEILARGRELVRVR